jgi:chromosomal replication initiation ATPase DnaA
VPGSFSFPVIARFFGSRNHTTVKSNVDSMRIRLPHDEELRAARSEMAGRFTGVTV